MARDSTEKLFNITKKLKLWSVGGFSIWNFLLLSNMGVTAENIQKDQTERKHLDVGQMTKIIGLWNTYIAQQTVHAITSDTYHMQSRAAKRWKIIKAKACQNLEKSTAILSNNET